MIVGNKWVAPLAAEQRFFNKALATLIQMRRLTPQARLLPQSVEGGEAIVEQGDTFFTLLRLGPSVELIDEAGYTRGRWLV